MRENRSVAKHQTDGATPGVEILELDPRKSDAVDRMCPAGVTQLVAREPVLGSVTMADRSHGARIGQRRRPCVSLSTGTAEWRKVVTEWRTSGADRQRTAPSCATRSRR